MVVATGGPCTLFPAAGELLYVCTALSPLPRLLFIRLLFPGAVNSPCMATVLSST